MRTFVKIYGPPLLEALDALQRIAAEMPKVTHYHMLIHFLPEAAPLVDSEETTHPELSKFGHTLGEYDFFFEWKEEPSWNEYRDLIAKIDKALMPLGAKYTLTSK